jgi:hypothetical protein
VKTRNPRPVSVLSVTPTYVAREPSDSLADAWCDTHHCLSDECGCAAGVTMSAEGLYEEPMSMMDVTGLAVS